MLFPKPAKLSLFEKPLFLKSKHAFQKWDDISDARKRRDEEVGKLFKLTDIIINKLPSSTILTGEVTISGVVHKCIDLDLSDEIAGILSTTFTAMRKSAIGVDAAAKYMSYKATIGETEINIADLVTEANTAKIEFDFLMATPIMNLLTCFTAFFDEVKTGVTKYQVREEVIKRTMKRKSGGQGTAVQRLKPEEKI